MGENVFINLIMAWGFAACYFVSYGTIPTSLQNACVLEEGGVRGIGGGGVFTQAK